MTLNELIEDVTNCPLEEGTVAFLVDREGTVIAHSGMNLFALEEGPLSLDIVYSDDSLVQAIMAGEEGMACLESTTTRASFSLAPMPSSGGRIEETPRPA